MESIDAYIYTLIAILGVAYPILLQVIARLDEKYSSDNIVGLFEREFWRKAFKYNIISSLIFILIWTLKLKPLFSNDKFDFLIENSASILVAINVILLVISFFFFVNKILVYYTPTKFISYLKNKQDKAETNSEYFIALSDILLLSIKNQQTNISKTLSDFFYKAFKKIRDKHNNKPIEYPDSYYEIVYKAIEELAILKEKRNYLLEHRTAGGIWLLGELHGKAISEKTYSWIWRNLLLAIRYQQDDLIVNHWETAHQFFVYNLPSIYNEYDYSANNIQVSNQDAVNKRIAERERFLEFHYALGGLLTYKERYNCLKRLFSHTNSQPPKYELLPESMNEIFNYFFTIKDPYEIKYTWISHKYSFPDLSGLNADYVIKKWICSYIAILLLRQYKIFPYLTIMRPLDFPSVPKTQGEIKEWIDGIDFFKKLVSDHLKNENLLKVLNLDFITHEWCIKNEKLYPTDFFDSFKLNLEAAYHINALTLPISEEKVIQYNNSTKQIIESTIDSFQPINNKTNFTDIDCDKWYVNGQRMFHSKDAFSENPEAHHIDFDSFLASLVSRSIYDGLGDTFYYKSSQSYLFKPEDIFKAIDKLGIDDNYVIVNFGLNIDYLINNFKIQGLSKEKYKNNSMYSFNSSRLVSDSLFIIKNSDLPIISTIPISNDVITKYSLRKISEKINLYASVIDLNKTSSEVFEENKQGKTDDELKKSVLLNIIISTEYKWKKDIEIVQLKKFSDYIQRGLINKLEDIRQFNKNSPAANKH